MRNLHVKLGVIFFKEDDKFIAYSPALDLSTCGDTFEHAQKRFSEAVDLFIEETIRMGTLDDVLSNCGWQKVSHPYKHWVPPTIIGQVQQDVEIPIGK